MKKVFTCEEVAKICKVAPRTVSKWQDEGKLRGYRIPGGQKLRFTRENLIQFLKEHGMPLGDLEPVEADAPAPEPTATATTTEKPHQEAVTQKELRAFLYHRWRAGGGCLVKVVIAEDLSEANALLREQLGDGAELTFDRVLETSLHKGLLKDFQSSAR